MTPHVVETVSSTDFWAVVFPAYLGAVGGLISALIGAAALVISLRNRSGVKALAQGLNERAIAAAGPAAGPAVRAANGQDAVSWSLQRTGAELTLTNLSTAVSVLLTAVKAVGETGSLSAARVLPTRIEPLASIQFRVDASLVRPTVSAFRIRWEQGSIEHSVTLYS